jgi:hypothetical protein
VLVFALMRLNREYRAETAILEAFRSDPPDVVKDAQHRVFACVNTVDIAMLEALRYGKGLHADELVAVHFMIDPAHGQHLRELWSRVGIETPLRVVDCPDRQLTRAAQELVVAARNEHPDANVTVLLPRRMYAPLLGRLLHDRTADTIARAVSRIPHAAATIVPYDVKSQISEAFPNTIEHRIARKFAEIEARILQGREPEVDTSEHAERVIDSDSGR